MPYTNQQVSAKVAGFLNDVYPYKTWYVVAYNGESSVHFSAHNCLPGYCIQLTKALGRYNVIAVGVDSYNVRPNTKLLVSQGWKDLLNSQQPQTDAYTQLYNLGQKYCFAAVLSLVGDH